LFLSLTIVSPLGLEALSLFSHALLSCKGQVSVSCKSFCLVNLVIIWGSSDSMGHASCLAKGLICHCTNYTVFHWITLPALHYSQTCCRLVMQEVINVFRVKNDFARSCFRSHNPTTSSISSDLGLRDWIVSYAPAPDDILWSASSFTSIEFTTLVIRLCCLYSLCPSSHIWLCWGCALGLSLLVVKFTAVLVTNKNSVK